MTEVVFACGRTDVFDNPGGDTTQMRKTRQRLVSRGVNVLTVSEPTDLDSHREADLLHLFNIPYSRQAEAFAIRSQQLNIPLVVSPIYWDFSHSLVVRTLANRLGLQPRPWWQSLVPYAYPAYHWLRSRLRSDAAFSLDTARLQTIVTAAETLLPNSKREVVLLAEWLDVDPDTLLSKTTVVPNAVDTALFSAGEGATERVESAYGVTDYVLEVGALSPNKNQLHLIDAMREIDRPLVLVGNGDNDYARRVRERCRTSQSVHHVESIPHEDLPDVYAAAAAHTLPSFRDSPGLVSLEAGLCATPLVVSGMDFCPSDEYFGTHAQQCNPYSVESIRSALRRALASESSETFQNSLRTKYSWSKAAARTYQAYETVLGRE